MLKKELEKKKKVKKTTDRKIVYFLKIALEKDIQTIISH